MLEYKGFKISGTSTPMYMEGCESRGSVFNPPEPVQSSNSRNRGQDIQDDEESGRARFGVGARLVDGQAKRLIQPDQI